MEKFIGIETVEERSARLAEERRIATEKAKLIAEAKARAQQERRKQAIARRLNEAKEMCQDPEIGKHFQTEQECFEKVPALVAEMDSKQERRDRARAAQEEAAQQREIANDREMRQGIANSFRQIGEGLKSPPAQRPTNCTSYTDTVGVTHTECN